MIPFLRQVVDHYYAKGDISTRCFIFPNRRSMLFFGKSLAEKHAEACAKSASMPIVAPKMLTISDFFHQISGLHSADRIELLLSLYECYKELNPKAESLDEFIFWGDVILGDFNDVDKYLADPKQLFTNVADFKAMQDNFSYLSDTQREAIESFMSHFDISTDINNNTKLNVKENFLQIWNILYPLYQNFNEVLRRKNLSYEGMAYRLLADRLNSVPASEVLAKHYDPDINFVFVGLNALNECEKTVLRRLRDCSRAEFCWDYSGDMLTNSKNRSSFFMSENLKDFPQALSLSDNNNRKTEFNVLSVPSSYGQVKQLNTIFEKLSYQDKAGNDCSDTAVVLPDETLLLPVLNSIPEGIENINVTMGYPMASGDLYTLMRDVARMQLHLRYKKNGCYFYHKQVWDILYSGIFRKLADMEGMELCKERLATIKKEGKYYIPEEDLSGNDLLNLIFRPVIKDINMADVLQIKELATYLQNIISYIAPLLSSDPDMAIEVEFAKEYYISINSLKSRNLELKPSTFIKLLESMMAGQTIPFKGEPLSGLQIMGPLETRALDFRNVVIMSCNEGVFPRRNVSSSFIPPELRKAFCLPTYEYQDAIWAYYFYRLISRAEKVWMVYDSRTEGLKRGEESRYIKQLKYHFGVDVKSYIVGAGLDSSVESSDELAKTDEMMDRINTMTFSVSALQNYVLCPMKFCYSSVLKLRKDEDVAESLDNAMIGNVYHNTMWALYHGEESMQYEGSFEKLQNQSERGQEKVTKSYLQSWLDREEQIKSKVASLMRAELNTDEISGRDLVVHRVIVRYVMETIRKDIALLDKNYTDAFEIIGLERKVSADINGSHFFGVIDRIDSLAPGMLRLVDYKSGSDDPAVIAVNDTIAETAVSKIFDGTYKVRKANKAALQFYIYDRMVQESGLAAGASIFNSLYSTSELFKKTADIYPLSEKFAESMNTRLKTILDEIHDSSIPFRRTEELDACEYCDFKMICGR